MDTKNGILLVLICAMLPTRGLAASGFYYGLDAIGHSLETRSSTSLSYAPPPPAPSTTRDQRRQQVSDIGLHFGYLHRHRRLQAYFLAPEFFLASFDSDELIYGTSFKYGYRLGNWNLVTNLGVTRVDAFKQNKLHLGVGLEFAYSRLQSISIEWIKLDTVAEDSSSTATFGAQTLTTSTETERDIEMFKLTWRFYLNE